MYTLHIDTTPAAGQSQGGGVHVAAKAASDSGGRSDASPFASVPLGGQRVTDPRSGAGANVGVVTFPPQQYPVSELESVTVSGTGETQNQTITLDNGRGQHTARLTPAPLALPARLVSNGATVLQGRIRAITLGASIRIEIEP